MCGIVGIVGTEPVATRLVDALKRLEYRGYDSAGVATLEAGAISRRRAEGKLGNLAQKLAFEPLGGQHRHRPHPLGDPWRAHRSQCPSPCHRPRRGGP
jgi:glucosamine 6-phosphate synthetase-like amidotransferase/phosphosugar isomerase protein